MGRVEELRIEEAVGAEWKEEINKGVGMQRDQGRLTAW